MSSSEWSAVLGVLILAYLAYLVVGMQIYRQASASTNAFRRVPGLFYAVAALSAVVTASALILPLAFIATDTLTAGYLILVACVLIAGIAIGYFMLRQLVGLIVSMRY